MPLLADVLCALEPHLTLSRHIKLGFYDWGLILRTTECSVSVEAVILRQPASREE